MANVIVNERAPLRDRGFALTRTSKLSSGVAKIQAVVPARLVSALWRDDEKKDLTSEQ